MRALKIIFYFSAIIVAILFIMFVLELIKSDWSFKKFGKGDYETRGLAINQSFHTLEIETGAADVDILPSGDRECQVMLYEKNSMKSEVKVEDGVLKIKKTDTRKWYDYIGFDLGQAKITVFLPDASFEAIKVEASTGNVEIKEISVDGVTVKLSTGNISLFEIASNTIDLTASTGDVKISDSDVRDTVKATVSTGDISLSGVTGTPNIKLTATTGDATFKNVSAASLSATASTGDAKFTSVNVTGELYSKRSTGKTLLTDTTAGKFDLKASTGDVSFRGSDAEEIFVEVTTGDVEGTLLSDKVYITKTNTGKIDVPKTITGGRCEITTTTGDIKISVIK